MKFCRLGEMCIRDSVFITEYFVPVGKLVCKKLRVLLDAVSYTHLTIAKL